MHHLASYSSSSRDDKEKASGSKDAAPGSGINSVSGADNVPDGTTAKPAAGGTDSGEEAVGPATGTGGNSEIPGTKKYIDFSNISAEGGPCDLKC